MTILPHLFQHENEAPRSRQDGSPRVEEEEVLKVFHLDWSSLVIHTLRGTASHRRPPQGPPLPHTDSLGSPALQLSSNPRDPLCHPHVILGNIQSIPARSFIFFNDRAIILGVSISESQRLWSEWEWLAVIWPFKPPYYSKSFPCARRASVGLPRGSILVPSSEETWWHPPVCQSTHLPDSYGRWLWMSGWGMHVDLGSTWWLWRVCLHWAWPPVIKSTHTSCGGDEALVYPDVGEAFLSLHWYHVWPGMTS